jgi:hypothetical protein
MAVRRISMNIAPVADIHSRPTERVIEYSDRRGRGGLISFRDTADALVVEPYRHDTDVEIRVDTATATASLERLIAARLEDDAQMARQHLATLVALLEGVNR